MSIPHPLLNSSQHSTKASSAKSNPKTLQKGFPGKENVNFLNFSKIAINSSSKSKEKRCNTDFPCSSFNISKFTTENVDHYKFQTEANSSYRIISSKNFPNQGHFRSQSIANMPYKMPVHEPNFKRPIQKPEPNQERPPLIPFERNVLSNSFQKTFQPQNLSISIQKKAGDLVEIPEISSPEKEENEENFRIYSLMKNFRHLEIIPKQQLIKKESFLSSFSNNETKSIISFPDELTNSAHKNLMLFKSQSTPKLLSNILKKHRIFNKNSRVGPKFSEKKAAKLLKCGEILEDLETMSNNLLTKSQNMSFKSKLGSIEESDSDVNTSVYRFLLERENSYQISPLFLKNQGEINPIMRAVLIDWMSEVSMEFCLKRHTLQQAIYYLDKYLELNKNIQKKMLQLVGVTSLLISSKLEEVETPRLSEFRKACDDGYSITEIKSMEMKIMRDLKWLLYPPTLQTWTDIFLTQWDLFIEKNEQNDSFSLNKIFFRKADEESYIHYRDFTQLIDVVLLDHECFQYKPRVLVASLLFLLLGEYHQVFSKNEILEEFTTTSKVLFSFPQFTYFFSEFSENSFGFTLYEMLPTIQYISQFFDLELLYELPMAEHLFEGNNLFEGYYEEFLSCHAHNRGELEYIKNKFHKGN